MLATRAWHRLARVAFALVICGVRPAAAQGLSIYFFDVGQGDAALVRSPEGKTLLIDAGPDESTVAEHLKQLHIDTLDLVVASHNHADHIRGLPLILSTIPVRFYMDNGVPATTRIYQRVLEVVQEHQIRYLEATQRVVQLGTATIQVLPRPPNVQDQNNSSVGLLLTFHGVTTLFTGDAEYLERDYWRSKAHLPHLAILKVAHHGSINGTDEPFIETLRPRFAIISVGAQNRYGHPSPETLRVLAGAGVEVYRTDEAGTIEVTIATDGTVTFHPERGVEPNPSIRIRASEDQQLPDSNPRDASVTRIRTAATSPVGATAQCRDATFSFSRHHRGTCSHHHGVARWLDSK
jgi:competence protein ComEC